MAFDAIMMGNVAREISTQGALKVEKIYQPMGDEIVIALRSLKGNFKLLINAGSNYPRICFTQLQFENPAKAPMFCMLLRKHLAGAKLLCVTQDEFERACFLEFEAYDEMGFKSKKYIICEIMGSYSNIILTDANKRIIAPLKIIDFSTSAIRQLISGIIYELPPKQNKLNPLCITREDFSALFEGVSKEIRCDKFIINNFMGMAPSTARQIAYMCGGSIDCSLESINLSTLRAAFFEIIEKFKDGILTPYLVTDKDGIPVEYSYIPIEYFGKEYKCAPAVSFSSLIDNFYSKKK